MTVTFAGAPGARTPLARAFFTIATIATFFAVAARTVLGCRDRATFTNAALRRRNGFRLVTTFAVGTALFVLAAIFAGATGRGVTGGLGVVSLVGRNARGQNKGHGQRSHSE